MGAGKSSVLELLSERGFFVVQADRVGHDVLVHDAEARRAIADRWPSSVIDGHISRPALAAIVFAEESELRELEAITHPAIRRAIDSIVANMGQTNVAVEVPVMGLLGDGWARVAVVAPIESRIARAVERGATADDVRARISIQPSDDDWIAWADHVIDNSADRKAVAAAVSELLETLLT
jgi:dephospho-CoA kinase